MANPTTNPKVTEGQGLVRVLPKIIRSWADEEGREYKKVSNPEDYLASGTDIFKVGKKEANTSYVRATDYVPSTRVSLKEENLVSAALAQGVDEETARKIAQAMKAMSAKK